MIVVCRRAMSGFYYKVTPEPKQAKLIGFKKVGPTELKDIVSRLTKPTYNRQLDIREPHKVGNLLEANS